MRRRVILILLLAAGGAVLVLAGGSSRDTVQDVAGSFGLVDDPPFKLGLSGALWA